MEIERLDPKLLDHLVVEFNDCGRRAVEFLETAQKFLSSDLTVPRLCESVAYCLREAVVTILVSGKTSEGVSWLGASQDVVKVKQRYELAVKKPGDGQQDALKKLLCSINDMKLTHDQKGIHERRLITVMVRRTGGELLLGDTAPVQRYQKLIRRLNKALHGECLDTGVFELWTECAATLGQLFLSPDIWQTELDALALSDSPTDTDLRVVVGLVAVPNRLQHFLTKIVYPVWLDLLAEAEVFNDQAYWPCLSAVKQIGLSHPNAVVAWLENLYNEHGTNAERATYIARAALNLGSPEGFALVLKAVKEHQQEAAILWLGLLAAERTEAADELVEDLGDILLNGDNWSRMLYCGPLLEQLAEGTNGENARRRIELLCSNLHSVPCDDWALLRFKWDPTGSIAEHESYYRRDDRFSELLKCLVSALRNAWGEVPAVELIELFQGLPERLEERLRSWLLANAPNVGDSLLVKEVERAISTRHPTGDDIALLDRAVEASETSDFMGRWSGALGDAPSVDQVSRALGTDEVPLPWLQALAWLSILPQGVADDWETPYKVLAAASGRPSREQLQHQARPEVGFGRSPYSQEELLEMEPAEAAMLISYWRPAPTDFRVSSRELAIALEAVVKSDPVRWAANPVSIATKLQHPTYINHYLQALAGLATEHDLPVENVLDLVQLVRTHSRPEIQLGHSDFDYDLDWRGAEHSTVDLLKALADANADFGDQVDYVWFVLVVEVFQRSEPGISSDHGLDPLNRAINRPCTRALQAVLSFMSNEFKRSESVRPEAVGLIESSLRLDGLDGAEHRAILATQLGFLRHILPEWMETNTELLFGKEAPSELAQLMVDQAIKWGPPLVWLLENHRKMVRNSVVRKVDQALERYLTAMLWECSGYGIPEVASFLQSQDLVSDAGEALGRLLRHDNAELRHVELAVELWQKILAAKKKPSLRGFGWFSEVSRLENDLWAELTLKTLEASNSRIDCAQQVADRVTAATPTATGLAILNELVRGGLDNEWDRLSIAEQAALFLSSAQDLAGTPEYKRLQTALLERGVTGS